MSENFYKEFLVLTAVFVLAILPFRNILLEPGLPAYPLFNMHPEYRSYSAYVVQGYGYEFGLGGEALSGLPNVQFYGILELLYYFTSSFEISFKFLILITFFIFSFAIYLISRYLLKISELSTIVSSILIIYFPYALIYESYLDLLDFLYLAESLFLLFFSIGFIETKDYRLLPLVGLFSFLSSGKVQYFILFLVSIFFYWLLTLRGQRMIKSLTSLFLVVVSEFLGTLYLVAPYILNPPSGILGILTTAQDTIKYASSYTSPVLSFTLSNKLFPNLHGSYASAELYRFMYLETLAFYFVVAVAFFSLLIRRESKIRKFVLLFAFMYTFGVLWYNGSNPPIPMSYYLVSYLPFSILRSTVHVWVFVSISLSFLTGYAIDFIRTNARIHKIITTILLLFLFIGIIFPIVSNGTFFGTAPNIQLPQEYREAINYFHGELNDNFFRIFMPETQGLIHYSWAPNNAYENNIFTAYWVPNIHLLSTPKVLPISVVTSYFDSFLSDNNSKAISILLGMMNVKYVVIDQNIAEIKNNYQSISNIALKTFGVPVKSFGNITIYKNPYFLPLVYVPSQVILLASPTQDSFTKIVPHILTNNLVLIDDTTIFEELKTYTQYGGEFELFTSIPNIKILYVHDGLIKVKISNITGPFLLVLSSSYNDFLKPNSPYIARVTHFEVNDFANGWLIVPSYGTKEMIVDINYSDGGTVYMATYLFSAISPLVILSFIILLKRKAYRVKLS